MDLGLWLTRVALDTARGPQATVQLANFVPVRQAKATLGDVPCPLACKTGAAYVADHYNRVTTMSGLVGHHLQINPRVKSVVRVPKAARIKLY